MKYALLKNLGWARLGQRRYREANVHLQSAIALAGNRAAAHCLLAQVLEAESDLKGAQAQWETCRQYADVQNPDEDVWILVFRLRWQRAPSREAVMTAKKLVKFASAVRE